MRSEAEVKGMPIKSAVAAAIAALVLFITQVTAQTPAPQAPAPQTPAPQAPPGPAGRGRGVFPAQQRPPADPALIERGKTIFSGTCSACHGADARGGQLGGPNLLRSQLVLNDQVGELITPIIHGSRAERGMPPIPMSDEDAKAVAEYLHSLQAAGRPQGAPPDTGVPPPDALVGDATAGQAYFESKCSSCHSATGDMRGIGTRLPEAKILQNAWVSGSASNGRGGPGRGGSAPSGRPVTATVTLANGEKVEGRLVQVDHFLVTLMLPDETVRSVRLDDKTTVAINDPLAGHRALWSTLTDKDMHDVTAYLATLK
jgi:cytochrome c oxidase cbb3-type subunit III